MSSAPVVAALGHAAAGRLDQARAGLRAHVARQPKDAEALRVLATLDLRAGAAEMGRFGLRRAGELGDAQAWFLLGLELARAESWHHAAAAQEKSTALQPTEPLAWGELGAARALLNDEAGALAAIESARRYAPDHPDTPRQFVKVLLRLGDFDGALGACRTILANPAADALSLHTAVYAMNNLAGVQESELFAAHTRLGDATMREHAPSKDAGAFTNSREPDRPLRVALLSCDFRRHSCAFFLTGLLPQLTAHNLRLYLYSTSTAQDDLTQQFRAMGVWRDAVALSPVGVQQLAAQDAIDIVVDLAGWTAPGQMHALAKRLAPVQVTYLGYPNTTGLATIDARLVDGVTDPAGSESLATERLVRLPGPFVRYAPTPAAIAAPDVDRAFTFGSLNAASKVMPEVMRTWAAVLTANPGSRLVIKRHALSDPALARHRATLAAAGVDPARLEVLPFTPTLEQHLSQYSGIDVALDTWPYGGTTTTCEALWMGVPVVTMTGPGHRSRVGASLLAAVGEQRHVASDLLSYVAIATRLAQEGPRDAGKRESLRAKVAASPLVDHAGLARAMSDSFRELWRERCHTGRIARP